MMAELGFICKTGLDGLWRWGRQREGCETHWVCSGSSKKVGVSVFLWQKRRILSTGAGAGEIPG